MGVKAGFRYIISIILLFCMAVACVVMFRTCMLEYEPYVAPAEEPVAEETVPEIVIEIPAVSEAPVPETEPEIPEKLTVEGITETGSLTEPVVEITESDDSESVTAVAEEVVEAVETVETVEEISGVPEAPDLDYFVLTEVYEPETDDWDYSMVYDDIDWSEFVFSDQEVVLPDGTYYAQLFVNDNKFGTIEVEIVDGESFFRKSDIIAELSGTLADDYFELFSSLDKTYYSIDDFTALEAESKYDSVSMYLYLYFNSSQVPVQTLSMGNSSSYSIIRQSYNVEGNIELEPAKFSFSTNMNAFAYAQYDKSFILKNLSVTLNLSNTISFWNMTINLPVSASVSKRSGIVPSIGNWNGYIDFPSENLRFSFGNVGNSGFSSGTPFGFTIEKNYSYGTGSAMGNQYSQTITLVEDSLVDIKVNGSSVYTRNLSLGVYRLTDFAFIQGANEIEVTIHPLRLGDDTSEDQTISFDQSYDTSLVAKGESTWRFGASIPKITISGTGSVPTDTIGFLVPTLPRYESQETGWKTRQYMYVLSDYSVFFEQSVGLSDVYSQSHSLVWIIQKQKTGNYSSLLNMSVSGTLATPIGSTRFTASGSINGSDYTKSSFQFSLSESFAKTKLKALSLSGSYSRNYSLNTFTLNSGYSMSLWAVKMSLSANLSYKLPTRAGLDMAIVIEKPLTGSISLSMSTSFGKRTSFSLSASMNHEFYVTATASLSVSLGSGSSLNSSANGGFDESGIAQTPVANASFYFKPKNSNKDSFQLSVSNIQFKKEAYKNFTYSGTWSHSGNLYSMSLREQVSTNYLTTSLSLSSALAFADGSFALARSVSGPFVIVSPDKSLKGADIGVSSATESNSQVSRKTLGNVLYSNLSMYKGNNVYVYASTGSLFSSSGSFLYKITPVARQGFLAKINLESAQTVSGTLYHNENSVYDTYSSPVYTVKLADNGRDVESIDSESTLYMFTDVDGRFILSDIKSGVYMFDLDVNGRWYAVFFEVSEQSSGKVSLLKDLYSQEIIDLDDSDCRYNIMTYDDTYEGQYYMEFDQSISEDDFWSMLFQITDEDYGWDEWSDEDYLESLDIELAENQTIEFDGDNASLVNAAP